MYRYWEREQCEYAEEADALPTLVVSLEKNVLMVIVNGLVLVEKKQGK